MAELLGPGTPAPDFEATDQDGNPVRMRDLRGRPIVLYFYPEDDTPGCTREACAFRDDLEGFRARGAVVLGVSTQDEASHREFRARYGLTFPLLADPEKRITRAYGALGLLGLAKRVTYVIGPDGRVVGAFKRIDPKSHSEEALRILTDMQGDHP
ncbi:MAG TPA: peroxiredoxin [Thermoplasmata archaeon]|nr:peroxiredoxin [Thermoplasmata archaeon]